MKIIKVLLVDEHTLIREGLKLILESDQDISVIDQARDGNEAIKKALKLRPDIVVMDINMPVLNGLESLNKMKELGITSKVIILTQEPKRETIIAATKLGAKGYLSKDTEPSNLIKAIREVYKGRSYLDFQVVNLLTKLDNDSKELNKIEPAKIDILTKREYEVLMLISKGHNNKTIGKELFISEKTVKNHVTQIFKKLEVSDRVQAVLFTYNNIK